MATEQEELQLTVSLNDQASSQLAALQQQLLTITNLTAPAAHALAQLSSNLRGAGGHAQSLHGSLGGLAGRAGLIGGFFFEVGRQLEHMAKQFAEAVLDIKAYADTMVSLDQVSSRAAQSMGQFRSNVAVFKESGLSGDEATKMLSGYANALAELQRPGNRILQDLLRGQQGAPRERMEDLIQTIMASSQTQGIEAVRAAGRAIREEHERKGRPELGAAAEASFFARLGMPGLEKVRGHLHEISAEEERMYNDRRKDAERYQTALEKQADAWGRSVESIQAIAFELIPIAAGAEQGGKLFTYMAEGAEALERAMRNTNSEVDKQRSEEMRKRVVTPEGKEITAQEGLSEDEQRKQRLQRRFDPRRTTTTRPGGALPPDFSDISETGDVKDVTGGAVKAPGRPLGPAVSPSDYYRKSRRVGLLGGEVSTEGGGPGGQLDVAGLGIPSIGDLLKPDPANAIVVPSQPGDFAGTGWRGLPMSKNVIDLRGEAKTPQLLFLEEQEERLGLLTTEVNTLNEYLQPELLKMLLAGTGAPGFHNAPQGGVQGESNPIQLPSDVPQPGGGAPAEARQPLFRPWRQGDPITGTYGKNKPYPILSPAATPLRPQAAGEKTYSGVSQGQGVATWFGYDPRWGLDQSDPRESNTLRVPETHQGISLSTGRFDLSGRLGSSTQSLGQFHHVTDPNTGLTHIMQQTDVGPGVRTQKLVDISAQKAITLGYETKRQFETQESRVERGEIAPWQVNPTNFGTYARPGIDGRDINTPNKKMPVVPGTNQPLVTQNIRELDTGKLIDPRLVGGQRGTTPGGIDIEYGGGSGGFDVGGGVEGKELPTATTPSLLQGQQRGPLAPGAPGAPVPSAAVPQAYTGPEEGMGKGFRLDPSVQVLGGGPEPDDSTAPIQLAKRDTARGERASGAAQDWLGEGASRRDRDDRISGLDDAAPITLAKRDTARGERANSAAQDWLGEAASRGDRDDRISSLDGSAIDRAAAGVDVNQSGRLSVAVNAPAGTSVKTEGSGVFNQTETTRSIPLEQQQNA